MSASKANKTRWWIVTLMQNLEVGKVFTPSELHLTFLPWFTTDSSDQEVIKLFLKTFQGQPCFDLKLTQNAMFGPADEVAVTLVNPSQELLGLHQKALKVFDELDAHWAVKNPYVGEEYKPHIRKRPGSTLEPGSNIKMTNLTLVKARRQEDNLRTVAAKAELT